MDVVVFGGIFREVLDADKVPRRRLGGSGVTAAVVAATFGASVALVSYVGEEDAVALRLILGSAGVDHSQVAVLPGASGTFAFPSEDSPVQHPWPMYRPAEATPDVALQAPSARVYLVFGVPDFDWAAAGWLGALPTESILLWDRQGWLSRARNSAGVSVTPPRRKIYLANKQEWHEEFPRVEIRHPTGNLPPVGFEAAVLKDGVRGCEIIDTAGAARGVWIDSFAVATNSTVGSGDAFAGILSALLAKGADLTCAVKHANAGAAAFLQGGGELMAFDLPEQARNLLEQRLLSHGD